MSLKLYDYQEKARKRLTESKGFLLAHDPGLGKTITSLAAARDLGLSVLVVAPAFMRKTWSAAIELYFPEIKKIEVTSWSKIHGSFMPDILIGDESHYAMNAGTRRAKNFRELSDDVRNIKNGFVWMLSGTPAKNAAAELWHQFKCLGHIPQFTYEEFAERYSFKKEVCYGFKNEIKYYGVRNLAELRLLYEPFMEVLKQKDCLELPEQVRTLIYSPASVFDDADAAEFTSTSGRITDSLSTKKRVQANMNVATTIDKVWELIDQGKKVVVFSSHVEPVEKIAETFNCPFITGEVSMADRAKRIETFRRYESVIACTTGAASTGLNLQFASDMVFNDLSWDASEHFQAEKRIHRIGQGERCFYHIVTDDGLGKIIWSVIERKMKMLEEIK